MPEQRVPHSSLRLRVLATDAEAQLRERLGPHASTGPMVRVEVSVGAQHLRRFLPDRLAKALALELRHLLRAQATEAWYLVAVRVRTGQSLVVASGGARQVRKTGRRRHRPLGARQPAKRTEPSAQPFGWLRQAAHRPNRFTGPPQPENTRPVLPVQKPADGS